MILVRYKPETREPERLSTGRVIESGVCDRVLSDNGIEMIFEKTTGCLTTVYRDNAHGSKIVEIRRAFSDESNKHYRLENPKIFRVINSFEQGTPEYEQYDKILRTTWRAAA